MPSDKINPLRRGETRRHFIKKSGMAAATLAGAGLLSFPASASENHPGVSIVLDESDAFVKEAPVQWAVEQLRAALAARGVAAQIQPSLDQASVSRECILVAGRNSIFSRQILDRAGILLPGTPEALALARGKVAARFVLLAAGSDARGLVYALLDLADRVNFAADPIAALKAVKPASERPANLIRSISRGFNSNVEDIAWFQDRAFWPPYLTMLAANRFNRFSLTLGLGYDSPSGLHDCYFYFAYPFLLSVPGYNVRAVPLPDAERDRNLEMLRFISEETARRGLHFQLGLWTHAYQWTDSPEANYTIEGLTPETQAPYCRDALRALLMACPAISGVTIRIHGESGVPEGNYNLWKTIFDGAAQCGRRVEIDMHAKGMDQGMIDVALGTGLPVNISPKFWAEHMGLPYMQGAIRRLEMPSRNASNTGFFSRSSGSRSFLRYGYGDLLAEDRRYGVLHRIWPGTQRLLLWGDPETAAAYGRVSSFCGSNGVELFEPLFFKGRKGSGLPGGRDAYADATLKPARDFEKYDYTYRVWGRNLYNPDGDADGWRRALVRPFGKGSDDMEDALASASRILPLVTTAHCPSAANNNYWPEMYYNMPIVNANRQHPYEDTRGPKRFGAVSPLDPEFFLGIDEFADELLGHEPSGKYSPAWVASQLEADAEKAAARLRAAKSITRDTRSADFRRLAEDVTIQAGLGRFFAAKFRAGVFYALYQRSGRRPALEEAIKNYRAARAVWAEFAETAKGVYVRDITFGPDYFQRDQWLDRLPAIDADIADMEALLKQPPENPAAIVNVDGKLLQQAMRAVFAESKENEHPPLAGFHEPAPSFQRGRPLTIVARAPKAGNRSLIAGLRLRYRRVNQAETWRMVEMERAGDGHRAVIPADYTDSPFPLQYYFQIRSASGRAWLHPGVENRWHGQPYFFVRQA
ncbi:MAG: twin-arginine translocation signal domain-containing protein [Verrucomicrobiota bacterium]